MDQGPSHFVIEDALAGQRLDRALALLMPELSRTRLKALMLEGAVTLNGQPATNPKHKTTSGDAITIQPGEKKEIPFTITVPKDAEPGGQYGAIFFTPPATTGSPHTPPAHPPPI